MPAIHLVIKDPQPQPDTRHQCPHPFCRISLPETLPACRKHRARLAARTASERDSGTAP